MTAHTASRLRLVGWRRLIGWPASTGLVLAIAAAVTACSGGGGAAGSATSSARPARAPRLLAGR
jgi:hypothetical protein